MPYPLPLTRTEAYLAYKAGVIQQSDLKPSLAVPRNGIDAWLAYWTGLAADYPKREDGTPHILQEEEAYIAYLCGVINEYPEKCLRRVGAYLRYIISARWGRPDHPLNREELYLSLIKTQVIPSGDPSSDIVIDGTAKAAFVDVKMYGDTFQQSYTGKNLLKVEGKWSITAGAGVTVTDGADGSLIFNGTVTAREDIRLYSSSDRFTLESGKTVTISREPSSGWNFIWHRFTSESGTATSDVKYFDPGASSFTYTTLDTDYGYQFVMRLPVGTTFNNTHVYLQLEESASPTSFEPYVGGTPSPNPSYPQPIQTVTGEQTVTVMGKNLFRAKDGQYRDNTLTVDVENGVIHIYGHSHATYDQNIWIPVEDINADGEYTLTMNYSGFGSGAFRLTKNKSYQAANNFGGTYYAPNRATPVTASATNITYNWALIYLGHSASQVEVDYYINPQFESGSSSTAYAPYHATSYPINLGKNLISANWESGRYNNSTGAKEPYSDNVRTDTPIVVQPNTTYICSRNGSGVAMNILQYKAGGSFIRADTINSGNSFTTGADTYFITMFRGASGGTEGIQLELGSTITSYAPYKTPIELCKLGTYQDYIWKDGDSWKVHKALNKTALNGSEAWYNAGGNAPFTLVIEGALITTSDANPPLVYCDKFYPVSQIASWSSYESLISTSNIKGSTKTIRIRYTAIASLSAFQTWLGSNNTTLYYVLATATDTVITDTTLIAQLEALVNGGAENGTTYIKVNATDPNLPGLLYVEAPKYE